MIIPVGSAKTRVRARVMTDPIGRHSGRQGSAEMSVPIQTTHRGQKSPLVPAAHIPSTMNLRDLVDLSEIALTSFCAGVVL